MGGGPEGGPVHKSNTLMKDDLVDLQKMDGRWTWKAVDTGNTPAAADKKKYAINIFYIPPNQRDIPRCVLCRFPKDLKRSKNVGTFPQTEDIAVWKTSNSCWYNND